MDFVEQNLIKLTCISSKPGNKKLRMAVRAGNIYSYAEATEEYIQLGAAAVIDLTNGGMIVVVESFDEIGELIASVTERKMK